LKPILVCFLDKEEVGGTGVSTSRPTPSPSVRIETPGRGGFQTRPYKTCLWVWYRHLKADALTLKPK